MSSDPAISLKNVSKVFKRYDNPSDRLRELLLKSKVTKKEFWALKDIDLQVEKGDTFGIIGRNGSGKSTLLQIIAGTVYPSTGEVSVNGRISALLELGSGFNPEFTGRQNVFFNGRILGLSQEEVESRFDDIVAFADIGDFLDQPTKTYSSGMFVRLAFAVAINVDPDILIVDEALSVGDIYFQQKCITKIKSLSEQGVSIFFVSHDLEAVKRLCKQVAVLDKGQILNRGSALEMTNWYIAFSTVDFNLSKMTQMEEESKHRSSGMFDSDHELILGATDNGQNTNHFLDSTEQEKPGAIAAASDNQQLADVNFRLFRHGDGTAHIKKVTVKTSRGQDLEYVFVGERIAIVVEAEFLHERPEHLVGIVIRDRLGTDIIGINTFQERIDIPPVKAGQQLRYEFEFDMHVKPGHYGISPSISYGQFSMKWMDWIDNALVINVVDNELDRLVFGIYLPPERTVNITTLN